MSSKFNYELANSFPDAIYILDGIMLIKSDKLTTYNISSFKWVMGYNEWLNNGYPDMIISDSRKIENLFILDFYDCNISLNETVKNCEIFFPDLKIHHVTSSIYDTVDLLKCIKNVEFYKAKRNGMNNLNRTTFSDSLLMGKCPREMVVLKGKEYSGFTMYVYTRDGTVLSKVRFNRPYKYFEDIEEFRWIFRVLDLSNRMRRITFKASLFKRLLTYFKRLIKRG